MSLRLIRSVILLLSGIAAISLNHMMSGFPALFGIVLSTSALLTVTYLFLNLNKDFDPKVITELIADGFSGIVLFTYPQSNETFFTIVFSFWIVFMGTIFISSALSKLKDKNRFPAYLLGGIILLVLGFIIINFTSEDFNSVNYLIGFALVIYSSFSIFFGLSRRREA